ncbi:MAG: MurR/RpiR family transcriptional regulator [Lactobacillus sp.]|nr:MurR/RpiR family transcriptional regulator [Lactobacillus sp.]
MLEKIKQYALNKQSSKSAIAQYIIDNLDNIEKHSLEDVARASFTSKASVVRFAQSLGYKGWTDFLPDLLAEKYYSDTHYSDIDHNLPFDQDDDLAEIIQRLTTIEKESIQDTADKLSANDLEVAAKLIKEAKRIVVFGLSPNEYLAYLFKRNMLTIGKIIEVSHPGEFGLTTASIREGDLAIIISYSGNSKNIDSLHYLPVIKKHKAKIIALTSERGQLLKQFADITFKICAQESKFKKIGNFSTEESILFILNTLYAAYFKEDFFTNYIKKVHLAKDLEIDR